MGQSHLRRPKFNETTMKVSRSDRRTDGKEVVRSFEVALQEALHEHWPVCYQHRRDKTRNDGRLCGVRVADQLQPL